MSLVPSLLIIVSKSQSRILPFLVMLALPACHAKSSALDLIETARMAGKLRVKAPIETRIELALTGYNYTSRYIDQFNVDGQGGGNISVSGPDTSGNGSACCVNYRSGAGPWKAKIRWQTGACTYNERLSRGEKFHDIHIFFKESDVLVDSNIPDFPRYFEVHIYPDGHAEAAITEHESKARLSLSKNREDRIHYSRCPNDKKPSE